MENETFRPVTHRFQWIFQGNVRHSQIDCVCGRSNVDLSVINTPAPYNAILRTPIIYSMKAIPYTYH